MGTAAWNNISPADCAERDYDVKNHLGTSFAIYIPDTFSWWKWTQLWSNVIITAWNNCSGTSWCIFMKQYGKFDIVVDFCSEKDSWWITRLPDFMIWLAALLTLCVSNPVLCEFPLQRACKTTFWCFLLLGWTSCWDYSRDAGGFRRHNLDVIVIFSPSTKRIRPYNSLAIGRCLHRYRESC